MNSDTLERLKLNPHYKPNKKQLAEMEEIDNKPIVKFGAPPVHNEIADTHNQTKRKKKL